MRLNKLLFLSILLFFFANRVTAINDQILLVKKKIKKANLKIVVDCSYGPTGKITPLLINDIGVEVIALNTHYRERASTPVPSINTVRNTADIVKASNSHLGVCFDVDGSRILVIDENGLEINYEDLLMLFISFDKRIQRSKSNTIITTPSISHVVRDFIEDSGFPTKQVVNFPGEIARQIREERACFAAADTLKYYLGAAHGHLVGGRPAWSGPPDVTLWHDLG